MRVAAFGIVLLLLASAASQFGPVTARVFLTNATGVASTEVLLFPRHLLSISPVGSTLVAVYCVDLTCKTTLQSTIWTGTDVTDVPQPHVLPDSGGRAPFIAFQHSQGQSVAFGRCQDPTCQTFDWWRDVIQQSAVAKDVFQVRQRGSS